MIEKLINDMNDYESSIKRWFGKSVHLPVGVSLLLSCYFHPTLNHMSTMNYIIFRLDQ